MLFSLTIFYFIALVSARPFMKCIWKNKVRADIHNSFEAVSILGVALFQLSILLEELKYEVSWLTVTALTLLGVLLALWFLSFVLISLELPIIEFETVSLPEAK